MLSIETTEYNLTTITQESRYIYGDVCLLFSRTSAHSSSVSNWDNIWATIFLGFSITVKTGLRITTNICFKNIPVSQKKTRLCKTDYISFPIS